MPPLFAFVSCLLLGLWLPNLSRQGHSYIPRVLVTAVSDLLW